MIAMIYGMCHTSLSTLLRKIEKYAPKLRYQILAEDTLIANRHLYIVTSVSVLRNSRLIKSLYRYKSTIIVLDVYANLASIKDVVILDANVTTFDKLLWNPIPVPYAKFKQVVAIKSRKNNKLQFVKVDVLSDIIRMHRDQGVLDKIQTYVHKIQDSKRDEFRKLMFRYFTGKVQLPYITKTLKPAKRRTQLFVAYTELISSLQSKTALTLRKVLTNAAPTFDSSKLDKACLAAGIDPFEARYLTRSNSRIKK